MFRLNLVNLYGDLDLESKLTDMWITIDEGGCKAPKYYYKSRLMTEYLIDIKHFSYDKILTDTISEERIFTEMLKWKDLSKGAKN